MSIKSLKNYPITVNGIANATSLIGLYNHNRVKGTAMRRKPYKRVGVEGGVNIPKDWYMLNKFVTLTADVMFVTGLTFFVTLLRKIRLVTADFLPHHKAGWLAKFLRK